VNERIVGVPFSGAIFDVDGVLVDSPHERAWRDALHELMEGPWSAIRDQTRWSPEAFTAEVYQRVVSGKPRMNGALAALDHFEVPDRQRRAETYAERKQTIVVGLIEAGEFTAFPDAVRFVLDVKATGLLLAAASSSKNADVILEQVGLDTFTRDRGLVYEFLRPGQNLLELFDADVSGRDFAQGKPHPEMFLTAAEELGLAPQGCFVVEDAVTGVQAARAASMSALGLARAGDYELLAQAHPDLVVTSLDDVDLDELEEGRLTAKAAAGRTGRHDGQPSSAHRPRTTPWGRAAGMYPRPPASGYRPQVD
jgi:beta-phosphoglucomutase-like phosphatase (HAD superfamily)